MFHELRIYTPAAGRLDDLVTRIGSVMVPFFERHRFSPRLGQWVTVAGHASPAFVWLLQWSSMEERAQAFAGLGADAEWQALRTQTGGSGEMVKRYDIRFLAAADAWLQQPTERRIGGPGELVELRVYPIAVGRTGAAGKALAEVDLPALAACGASLIGVFDNIAGGPATPGITMLLGWSDFEQRQQALALYEQRPAVVKARLSERAQWNGEHALGEGSSVLLMPTRFASATHS